MLREINHVAPGPDGQRRRWFTSDYFDLFVFYDAGQVDSFQLCYDKDAAEHALNWRSGRGFAHHRVDSGEATPIRNLSPIFATARHAFPPEILDRFRRDSANIDPAIAALVVDQIERYNATRPAPP